MFIAEGRDGHAEARIPFRCDDMGQNGAKKREDDRNLNSGTGAKTHVQ
jgi:hypothetical protein